MLPDDVSEIILLWSVLFLVKQYIASALGPVWYMCLKTENCYLKTFVEIRVGEKVH